MFHRRKFRTTRVWENDERISDRITILLSKSLNLISLLSRRNSCNFKEIESHTLTGDFEVGQHHTAYHLIPYSSSRWTAKLNTSKVQLHRGICTHREFWIYLLTSGSPAKVARYHVILKVSKNWIQSDYKKYWDVWCYLSTPPLFYPIIVFSDSVWWRFIDNTFSTIPTSRLTAH